MFRGWCLSIKEMKSHRLQLRTQQRCRQTKSKEGDFSFFFFPTRWRQGDLALLHLQMILLLLLFIKPGDYWKEKVCSMWLGRGSQLLKTPGSSLPSGLLSLMTSLYHSVSYLCQQLSQQRGDALWVALRKQETSSSQKAYIELWLPTK